MNVAQETGAEFLRVARREFRQSLEKIEKAVAKLEPEQIWARSHESENAIGNLLLHLAGNVRQWIVSGVGGVPDERDRDAEFAQRERIPVATVLAHLKEALAAADATLAALPPERLLERRHIQVYDVTLLHAIFHCVEHFGGHTGQILWAVKRSTGEGLGLYDYLQEKGPKPEGLEP